MSKITKIRTVRLEELPNSIWIEIETDEGLTGLGEAWRGTAAVETVLHEEIAPWLLGQDSRRIEYISRTLTTPYVGFHSSGAEIRAASAVDIALWDLFGKRSGIPVYEALGGASRISIQVYNTCSGYLFNGKSSSYNSGSSRRMIGTNDEMQGPYDDQIAFNKQPGKLAESLLEEGYRVMKIWPFDEFAVKSGRNWISREDLEKGLKPFKEIRKSAGNSIEIMCELHSLWSAPAAAQICQALERYGVFWAEDPLCKMDDIDQIKYLRTKTRVPICGSETLSGAVAFRQMFAAEAFDYAMLDLGWCGGLTEGRKIAALAESYNIPVSPHDCTGPVLLWAGLHLGLSSPAGLFQEVVRANLATWYKELVTDLPEIENGFIKLPAAPGLGTSLRPEVKMRKTALVRESGE